MIKKVNLNHVAMQCSDRERASIFFTEILNIPKIREFSLTKELSSEIFGIEKSVEVDVYDNEKLRFEVFIIDIESKSGFEHICIEIDDKKEFINSCQENGLKPFIVKKGERNLLFVRDFSSNLYEIKEKIK